MDRKFVKKARHWAVAVAVLLAGSVPAYDAQTCTLTQTSKAVALSNKDIARLAPQSAVDASISTFRTVGKQYWIVPTVRLAKGKVFVNHAFTEGPPDDLDARHVGTWSEEELFGDAPGLKWITNTYQAVDGILAFVHTEYALPGEYFGKKITGPDGKKKTLRGPGHSRIGLAWYPDPDPAGAAPKFQYLGHIIAPYRELDFEAWNVHGTPYVVRREGGEDWFYIYYFDVPVTGQQGHLSTARAKVADVLAAARKGRTTPWQKYHNGQWTKGLGGKSSPLAGEHTIVHSDAAQSSDGRFYLANTVINNFRESGKPSAIVVYDSCDALNWREAARLESINLPPLHANKRRNHGWQYLTILDHDGTDNGRIKGEMQMLVGYQYNKPERAVMSLRYSLGADCGCPAN